MLNLDDFTYSGSVPSGSGSMSLPISQNLVLHSGQVSIRAQSSNSESVLVTITRTPNTATKKPVMSSASTWNTSDANLLESSYLNNSNGVQDIEIKINNVVTQIIPSIQREWKPTYLDPFKAPRVPTIGDLPEGQYLFSLRVRDNTGSWSDWTDSAKINIDQIGRAHV